MLTTLFYFNTQFYFTTINMKSLTTLTAQFHFTTVKTKSLTTLTTLFKFTTIKVKSWTTLTTLFYFTTINPRYRTTVTALFLSIKYFSSQEFQCFHKIYMCYSNFIVRKFSGVLRALLPLLLFSCRCKKGLQVEKTVN